jgi:hypothetical protein
LKIAKRLATKSAEAGPGDDRDPDLHRGADLPAGGARATFLTESFRSADLEGHRSAGDRRRTISAVTYSLVAFDPDTGECGVAVQSHWFSVGTLVTWGEPGVGAVATQANVEIAYGPRGLARMRDGASAPEALVELVGADQLAAVRQVAMVDAYGGVAAHTGADCMSFCGQDLGHHHSAQGNLMASDRVWGEMSAAFLAACGRRRPGPPPGRWRGGCSTRSTPARRRAVTSAGASRRRSSSSRPRASRGGGWSSCGSRTIPSRWSSCAGWPD